MKAMTIALVAGLVVAAACTQSKTPSPSPAVIPADGVHVSGAITGVYPISNGGTCPVLDLGGKRELGISSNPRAGQPYFGAAAANFVGPGTYTDVQWPADGHSSLYAAIGGRSWRASSGLISVKSYGNGRAAGTVWAPELHEVGGSTTVSAAGSWTCRLLFAPPAPPSPSPLPIAFPSPTPLPIGTPVQRQALPPSTDLPVAALCSTPLQAYADGNAGPLFCRGGEVNVLAWKFYAGVTPTVLGLGLHPTQAQVEAGLCHDGRAGPATRVELMYGYEIAAAYYGWKFAIDPGNPTCS